MDYAGTVFGYSGVEMTDRGLNASVASLTLLDLTTSPTNGSNRTQTEEENIFIMEWYLQVIYSIAFVSMVTVAAAGNIIVIWIVLAHRRMRTVTNYFLVNLALADALISIFNTLFNFIYMLNSDWLFGKIYCQFSLFIAPCTISVSVFTFMAIAIDRYMAIIHPLKPRMTRSTVIGAISVIWLASILIALPLIIYSTTHTFTYKDNRTRTVCYTEWADNNYQIQRIDFAYSIFLMLVNYFLPLLILAVTYSRVGIELWGSQAIGENTVRQAENVRNKRRVVKMMIVVVVIFGVCWLPQHTYLILTNIHTHLVYERYIQHVYLPIYWLAMSNSMYNPIIYCWMNERFRKGFKYVFRFLPCVKWSPSDSLPVRRMDGVSVRFSVSDGGRYERNGSMMHTIVENMNDSSYSSSGYRQTSIDTGKEESTAEGQLLMNKSREGASEKAGQAK